MKKGRAIFLNGGSSSGKTTMAKALQEILPEPHMLLGIDLFWFTMPPKQIDLSTVDPEYYTWVEEQHDGAEPFFRIVPGPILDQMMYARYRAMVAYLDAGMNVVADEVLWKRDWLEECLRVLNGYDVFYFGVYCDDRVLNHREIMRGDRMHGWGRGSQFYTHKDAIYDMTVDTSVVSSNDCAEKIKAAIEAGLKPTAFEAMRARLLNPLSI